MVGDTAFPPTFRYIPGTDFWTNIRFYPTSNRAVSASIEYAAYASPMAESEIKKVEFSFQPLPAGFFRRA